MTTPTAPAGTGSDRHVALDTDSTPLVPAQRAAATAEAAAPAGERGLAEHVVAQQPVAEHVVAAIRVRRPGLAVRASDRLTSLGLDSLDRLAVTTFLEQSAGLTLPDPALANAVTVADLIAAATPVTSTARPLTVAGASRHPHPADPHSTDPHSTGGPGTNLRSTASGHDEETGHDDPGCGWVDPGGSVGPGTRLWHQAQVSAGARIGADCTLGKGVFVGSGAVVGNRVKIGNYASLFGATVGDEAMISPGALLLEDPAPRATNPNGQPKGPDDFIRRPVIVGPRATIGASAAVAPGVRVGDHAMVAVGAVVAHDVPAHALVAGNPARQCGWVCRCGSTLHEVDGQLHCPACPRTYSHDGDRLVETN